MVPSVRVLPSLLASDFGSLRQSAVTAERAGGDALHLDVMDGHFAPNLSMGPEVVRMAREAVHVPLNVHLMISNPDIMAERFVEAGADSILIHVEPDCDIAAVLRMIKSRGRRAGITLNPETPADAVAPFLSMADEVLCMTVSPGWGGQAFITSVLPKIRTIRGLLTAAGRNIDILVDGGIDENTAAACAASGANAFIAGTWLFKASDMAARIALLRSRAEAAFAAGALGGRGRPGASGRA